MSEFLDETWKCYLQEKVQSNLIARETTYEMFIQKLAEGKTNRIDIAILAICEMFDISIIVLFENYLWKLLRYGSEWHYQQNKIKSIFCLVKWQY